MTRTDPAPAVPDPRTSQREAEREEMRLRKVVRVGASTGAAFVPLLLCAVTVAIVVMIANDSFSQGAGSLVAFAAMATIGGSALIGAGVVERAGGKVGRLASATICSGLGLLGAVAYLVIALVGESPRGLPGFTRLAAVTIAIGAVLVIDQALAVRRITSPRVGVLVMIARVVAWLVFSLLILLLVLVGNVGDQHPNDDVFALMTLAIMLLLPCGLVAASMARRLEARDVAARDTLSITAPLRLVCPKCATALAFRPGVHVCTGCRFAMKIAIEEPRCRCGYVLYLITGETCPECGAAVTVAGASV